MQYDILFPFVGERFVYRSVSAKIIFVTVNTMIRIKINDKLITFIIIFSVSCNSI